MSRSIWPLLNSTRCWKRQGLRRSFQSLNERPKQPCKHPSAPIHVTAQTPLAETPALAGSTAPAGLGQCSTFFFFFSHSPPGALFLWPCSSVAGEDDEDPGPRYGELCPCDGRVLLETPQPSRWGEMFFVTAPSRRALCSITWSARLNRSHLIHFDRQ